MRTKKSNSSLSNRSTSKMLGQRRPVPKKLRKKHSSQIQELKRLRIAQRMPIKYMVFSGGGAKGNIYAGNYAAAKELGIFDQVEACAGSSAGAITAALSAIGISAENFRKISRDTNLRDLLGKEGVSLGPIQLAKDGKPLYDLLDNTIRNNVLRFFPEDTRGLDAELLELHARCQQEGKIYFRDLTLLRKHDPKNFKDLVITAVRQDNGALTIFSTSNTPNVEIAAACRASAALPVVFKPVEIDGVFYVDGGYRDNTPIQYFPNNEPEFDEQDLDASRGKLPKITEVNLSKKQDRVFIMAFGNNMDASPNIAIYSAKPFSSPSALMKFLIDVLFKMLARVGGIFRHTDESAKTREQLRENPLNTVVLNTKEISTLDFDLAQKYADYLFLAGFLATKAYLINHEMVENVDPIFQYQQLLLSVYEEYNKQNLNRTFGQKIVDAISPSWQEKELVKKHDAKAAKLLSFCEPSSLSDDILYPKLKEYIVVAASSPNNKLAMDTNAMQALITTLNGRTTPLDVKTGFIQLLNIDIGSTANIADYEFSSKDFQPLLDSMRFTPGFTTGSPRGHG